MYATFEVSNRTPLRKGNRKLDARAATQKEARVKRLAPNLARAADELFAAKTRREKTPRVNATSPEDLAQPELSGPTLN